MCSYDAYSILVSKLVVDFYLVFNLTHVERV